MPTQIRHFLQHLKTKFDKIPKALHTACSTEFLNSELQEEILARGIKWYRSLSRVPEQNGIVGSVTGSSAQTPAIHCGWPMYNADLKIRLAISL